MATVTVDQAELVLNAFAAIFQNNLLAKDLVTWNKFTSEMNDRNALTVVEQVVPDYTTTFTTNGVANLSGGVQDTTFGSEQYKIDQTINSSMGWGDFVKIRDLDSARESEALKAAALRLATDIDSYIIGFAAKASNNWLGDGSTAISSWEHIARGYRRLKDEGVDDADTVAVLDYEDWQALGATVLNDNASLTDVGEGVYRAGFSGKVAGIPTRFTQQLPTLTVGSRVASATSVTNQASSPAVSYADVCISGTPGNFLTSVIDIDGQTGSVTLKDGEIFTIAGVYAYDNRAKKQLGHLQQFRVIGDYTASSGAWTDIRVFPAIITSGPHQTVVNTNGGGTWDGLAVTHLGAASTTLKPRFIANKQAIVVNTADLIMPATGQGSRKSLSKVPLSVRMWKHSDFNTGAHSIRFDVALKANVLAGGRRRVVRINGGS
jgi:hypothetical protein